MAGNSPASLPSQKSLKLMRLGVVAAAIVLVGAGIAFYEAARIARRASPASAAKAIPVTIAEHTCQPNDLSVPAGTTTFQIVNKSDRTVEWEILDGVMVVDERENIAPGFSQNLTTKLSPGTYQITCGLLDNPRGALHVTGSSQANSPSGAPPLLAFIGALAEYKVFLTTQASTLGDATQALAHAIDAGDLAQAKTLYVSARVAYEQIGPVADAFSDLSTAIDANAAYFDKREQDPDFTGFHRIEYGLFEQGTTQGLAPYAKKLVDDVTALQSRIHDAQLPPDQLAASASKFIARMADASASGETNLYAHTDLADIEASVAGSRKIADLLRPLVVKSNADLVTRIDADYAAIASELAGFRQGEGFVGYDSVGQADRAAIADKLRALATDLDKVNPALGLV